MKKLKYLFTVLLVLCITITNAEDFLVNGIYYNITSEEDKTVEVTFSYYLNGYTGNVTIPESVTYKGITYSVTNISNNAFSFCSGLTSITIGNSVTSIGDEAFSGCSGLTSIVIPNGVTSIGDWAFNACSALTSIVIPNGVTSIGDWAFSYCSGLTSITIGNSVTSIGWSAFSFCSGLTSIEIPNSVTSIGNMAFSGCSGLTSITIPNSVTSIGLSAFSFCSGLTSITIGNSVTSIGDWAFNGCSALKTVTSKIPAENLFELEADVFNGIPADATLCVSGAATEEYQNTAGWNVFSNYSCYDYIVKYILNGEEYRTYYLEAGEGVPVVDAPEKEGHDFSGWSQIPEVMPADDVVVEGGFSYTVIFMVDGTTYNVTTAFFGSPIVFPVTPEKEGHTFVEWENLSETIPAEDLVSHAVFKANKYKVMFVINNSVIITEMVEYGTEIPLPEGVQVNNEEDLPATMPARDLIINATYKSYTLTLLVEGQKYAKKAFQYKSKIPNVKTPFKEGYTFKWDKEIPETMPAEDLTINGYFIKNGTAVDDVEAETEKVVYDLKGNRILDTENLERGIYIINGVKTFVK